MKLLPAEEADMTDVELSITKGKQINGSLSVDDSGLEDTGSIQWNAALGIDRLFNANDLFRISGNTDGSRDGYEKGTRGQGISYSIPRGWDTFTLQHNRYRYHRTVKSDPYDFISSGKTRITKFTFSHVMGRNKNERYGWDISLTKRNAHYFINDMEIPVQAMDTTAMEIASLTASMREAAHCTPASDIKWGQDGSARNLTQRIRRVPKPTIKCGSWT